MKYLLTLLALVLLTGCGQTKPLQYERKFHEVCGSIMNQECTIRFLKEHNDFSCDGGLCCGGNSIGWYECF